MARIWTALALAAALGCSWVKLTEAGETVHLGTPAEAVACDKLGVTHSNTRDQALVFARSPKKVDEELEYLARNEAAQLGGDTIVPLGPTSAEGRRSFAVYRCR